VASTNVEYRFTKNNYSPYKFVITGGSGFVGQNLVKFFDSQGYTGLIVDKTFPSDVEVVKLIKSARWLFADLDIADNRLEKYIDQIIGKIILIHCAANVTTTNKMDESIVTEMVAAIYGSSRLVQKFENNLIRIIYLSSVEVYGSQEQSLLTENSPTKPINFYGLTKLATENLLRIYCEKENIKLSILRLPQIYGPGDNHKKVIKVFINNCLSGLPSTLYNGGYETRPYINVKDVGIAISKLIENEASGIFNLSGGQDITILSVLNIVQELMNTNIPYINQNNDDVARSIRMNINKAKEDIGFIPSINFANGVKEIIEMMELE
jgi:UDP-glucose 4-epimerase